jgi:hypothetical protein
MSDRDRERNIESVTAQRDPQSSAGGAVFEWHPQYAGRPVESVTRELGDEIARDQRSYELTLQGAEESEHDALASVVDLDRRWSTFDFGWSESDPHALARKIAAFEWEREQRREMISWQEYRSATGSQPVSAKSADWRESMSDGQRRTTANVGAAIVLGLIVLVIIFVVISVL